MPAHIELSPNTPNSLLDLWAEYEVEDSSVAYPRAARHQSFWDALNVTRQEFLLERCPYFDPSHEVWSEPVLCNAAFTELVQMIAHGRRTALAVRVQPGLRKSLAAVFIGLALVAGAYLNAKVRGNLSGSSWDKPLVGAGIFTAAALAYSLSVSLPYHYCSWKMWWQGPKLSYTPLARIARMQLGEAAERLPRLADYEKNCAAIEHWRFKGTDPVNTSERMWSELSEVEDKGKLTSREKRQLFWDSQALERRSALFELDASFDPEDEAWQSEKSGPTRQLELELDLLMAQRHLRAEWSKNSQGSVWVAVIGVFSYDGGSLVSQLIFIFALLVQAIYPIWKAYRRQTRIQKELRSVSSN